MAYCVRKQALVTSRPLALAEIILVVYPRRIPGFTAGLWLTAGFSRQCELSRALYTHPGGLYVR